MKRNYFVLLLILLSVSLFTACTNLDDIYSRLDDHDKRLKTLEALSNNVNKEVQNLKILIESSSIKSYKALPDGSGYELVMGGGKTITLKNGTKPTVGVKKDEDGKLYWTIDDDWLRDADNQKVRAEGEDGAETATPQFRVDADGYWEVSMDGGKLWQSIMGADGKPVKAVGQDGTADLDITEKDGVVIIQYNGQTFKLPINAAEAPDTPNHPRLPLENVAEFNVNTEGNGFTTSHEYDKCGFFSFEEAVEKFKTVEIDGKTYHMPSKEEWLAVVPVEECIYFDWDKGGEIDYDLPETVMVNGKTIESTNDYKTTKHNKTYALRYKGTDLMSAWLYEYTEYDSLRVLKITACYVGDQPDIKLADITKTAFWEGAKGKVVRVLPAAGKIHKEWGPSFSGSSGVYLSSTANGSDQVYCMVFDYARAYVNGDNYTDQLSRPVRLFESAK